jgi:putative hemolysin
MTPGVTLLLLILCVFAAAIFSGGETGLYSLSRARVEAGVGAARQRSAQTIQRLLRDDTGLLITLLLANNAVNQLAAHLGDRLLGPIPVPEGWREVVLTLLLAPPLFLFGDLLPKDMFLRRPHALVGLVAPGIALVKVLLWPLTAPLTAITTVVSQLLGQDTHELARVQGREAVMQLLRERRSERKSEQHGAIEAMAANVLELRSLRIERVMVPWRRVEVLPGNSSPEDIRRRVGASVYTRLPVVDAAGLSRGYVHQLEVLAAGPQVPLETHLRPLMALEPSTSIDRALIRLRQAGQRTALVGSPGAPLGLVTLKDLVEEISGELHRW